MHTGRVMFAFVGLALVARPAHAGALGDVIGGIVGATGSTGSGGGKSSSGSGDIASAVVQGIARGLTEAVFSSPDPTSNVEVGGYYVPPAPQAGGVDLYLYVGAQSVVDSDGAMSLELRGTYEDFGLGVKNTSYFERGAGKTLHLDLWAVSAHYRLWSGGDSNLWAEAGLGGVNTLDDLTLHGVQGGLHLDQHLGGALGVGAEGRVYRLADGVDATELRASFSASILTISYRLVDFNVGPPLHGPEIGVTLQF